MVAVQGMVVKHVCLLGLDPGWRREYVVVCSLSGLERAHSIGPSGWNGVVARWLRSFVGAVASLGIGARTRRLASRGFACLVVSCAVLTLLTGAAAASGSGPKPPAAEVAASNASLVTVQIDALSCSSPRACTAVDEEPTNGVWWVIQRWDGKRWSNQQVVPSDLESVSCPSNGTCFAAGFDGPFITGPVAAMERWTGGSWSGMATPSPGDAGFTDVSCSSPKACLAIGSVGGDNAPRAESWNGTSWSIVPAPVAWSEIDAVSCPSTSGCIATGRDVGEREVVARWNGTSWLPEQLPSAHRSDGVIYDLSCSSLTACVGIGGWDTCEGGDLVHGSSSPGPEAEAAEGCSGNLSWSLRGSRWLVRNSPDLSSVSCVSASWCMAGGYQPYLWNGQRWSRLPIPRHAPYPDVSCPSVKACIAVSHTRQGTMRWNGARWLRISALPRAPASAPRSVGSNVGIG